MNCPTCGQPAELNAAIVDANVDWDWLWDSEGRDFPGVGEVTVKNQQDPVTDSYGYVDDGDIHIVVEVAGRFFQKDGTYQSWSGRQWDGKCREVKPQAKQVTVYEFA